MTSDTGTSPAVCAGETASSADTVSAGNDDAQLLHRIAGGDRQAFRQFYDRHSGKVYAVLRHICRETAVIEDALQEVFLAVWRRAVTYRAERGAPAGWLYTITRNKVFDLHRRRRIETPVEDLETWLPGVADVTGEVKELRISLDQALSGLEPEQRDAVHLAYFGGYTYAETAQRLSLPLGTVKSRIRTGLRRLKTILEGTS